MARAKSKQNKDRQRAAKHQLAEQQKAAKHKIMQDSYHDALKRETVSRSTTDQVLDELNKQFGTAIIGAVPEVEEGLVLSNDYGQGIFQV